MRGILTFTFFGVDAYVALALVEWRGQTARYRRGSVSLPRRSRGRLARGVPGALLASMATGPLRPRRAHRRDQRPDRLPRRAVTPGEPVGVDPDLGLAGLGMGLAYAPLTLIVLREAAPQEQGSASSALSLTDALGTALGTGVTGAIVAASVRQTGEPWGGPRGRRVRGGGRRRGDRARPERSASGGPPVGGAGVGRCRGGDRIVTMVDGGVTRLR